MKPNYVKYIRVGVVTIIILALIVKSIYKLLGYGIPISGLWKAIYAIALITGLIGLPVFVYKSLFKKE